MLDHLRKWWAVYGAGVMTVVAPLLTAYLPIAQSYLTHHMVALQIVNGLGWLCAALTKSPRQR